MTLTCNEKHLCDFLQRKLVIHLNINTNIEVIITDYVIILLHIYKQITCNTRHKFSFLVNITLSP
jgi:hypothetical protein